MKLTILGSGTVDPQPHRACSGYHLQTSEGELLFDLGNGALRRAVGLNLNPHSVSHLFLSHLHPDHTADLIPLLFARKYAPPPWDEVPPLTIHGPQGTKDFLGHLYKAWPSLEPKESDSVVVDEIPAEKGEILEQNSLTVGVVPVEHGDMEAFAYWVRDEEKVLVYSGDTKLCEGIKNAAWGADLFICECSCFPRGCEPLYCREVHLSWEDVAEICEEANPLALVLTHLYEPVLNRHPNPLESLKETLDIPVYLAADGDVYEI